MLNKLVKFECKSMGKYLCIAWAALLAATIIAGVTFRIYGALFYSYDVAGEPHAFMHMLLRVLPSVVFWVIFVAEILITIIMVLARFYGGLLGNEGYLMHTLPVKTWQLIDAKGIVATAAVIISGIVAFASVIIWMLLCYPNDINFSLDMFEGGPAVALIIIEAIIIGIIALAAEIYKAYAAMAIGQLAGKHRILLSVAVFIGINTILSIIVSIGGGLLGVKGIDIMLGLLDGGFAASQILMVMILVPVALEFAVFHVVTERMLNKKLNLL